MPNTLDLELIKTIATVTGAMTAICGAVYAARQYSRAKTLEKRRLAWEFLRRFREEEPLKLCAVFLDWSARTIEVPEEYASQYRREFDQAAASNEKTDRVSGDDRETIRHSWERMHKALATSTRDSDHTLRFDWAAVIYRDSFDRFFDYLKEIQAALRSKWLDPNDLSPLSYWLELLTTRHKETFAGFLATYHPELDLRFLESRFRVSLNPPERATRT
jgi:hypothetical protein